MVGLLKLIQQEADDALIKVIAAQVIVAGGCQNLNGVAVDVQNTDIEGAASQVIHHDLARFPFAEPVGQSSGGGLVDNTEHIEAGNQPGILGCLPLRVGEISGNGNDCIGNLFADKGLGILFQFAQDHGGNLLRRVGFAVHRVAGIGPHVPLDRGEGARGICDGLPLGGGADEPGTVLQKSNNGGGGPAAFRVGNNGGMAVLHKTDAGIGGSKVDTDEL